MKTVHDLAEIARAAAVFVPPGQVTEARALDACIAPGRYMETWSGYFDDPGRLADAVAPLTARGIYFIPNEVNADLLARAVNRVRAVKKEPTTADADIVRRRWLLVDCDPVRAAGISASEAEHDAALTRAEAIQAWMVGQGWPRPALADSGNGGHVLARVDLPAEDGGLIARCLAGLGAKFGDHLVKVDQSVHNPARIWKLYGTLAAKGDNTPSRPHRLARLLELPGPGVVSLAQLDALAAWAPQQAAGPAAGIGGSQASGLLGFDVERWADSHGLQLSEARAWKGAGKRWVLPVCPMNPAHTDKAAYIVQLPNGALDAGCQHESCRWGWAELRAKLEPEYSQRLAGYHNGQHAAPAWDPPPARAYSDNDAPLPDHELEPLGAVTTGATSKPPATSTAARVAAVEFVNAAELLTRTFPPQRWAVDGIVPAGTYILAGRPKVGKSWLALALAIAVASGKPALDHAQTTQGDVLYLGLEDSFRRMQTRIKKLLNGGQETLVDRLMLLTECPRVNDGGELILSQWLDEHPAARLVVIDTLQRFRPRRRRGGDGYEDDYEALQPLLTETKRRDISVIVVHHLRKLAGGDDIFDAVSGTLGLTGAVDGTMVLQRVRGKADATLHIVGRDLPDDLEMGLRWEAETATWRYAGSAADLRLTQVQFVIISALRDEDKPLPLKDLHDIVKRNKIDLTYDALKMVLSRMIDSGKLWKAGHGLYAMTVNPG